MNTNGKRATSGHLNRSKVNHIVAALICNSKSVTPLRERAQIFGNVSLQNHPFEIPLRKAIKILGVPRSESALNDEVAPSASSSQLLAVAHLLCKGGAIGCKDKVKSATDLYRSQNKVVIKTVQFL